MKCTRFTVIVTVLAILVLIGGVRARSVHPSPTEAKAEEPHTATDPRISLNLEPAVQSILMQTMQEHLMALQAIVSALAQERRYPS
jgi:hypothetical protein